jgi:Ni/Co efflux regulator RcnB
MTTLKTLMVLPLLVAFAATPAMAKKNGNNGNGNHGNGHAAQHDDHNDGRHNDGHHDNGRHLGWYKQRWRRGDRVEVVYIEPAYYVTDYRTYNLRTPPPGYRWVRPMDDRYILVEVATGLIAEALGY